MCSSDLPVPHMLIGFFKDDAEIMLKPSVFASICTDLDNFPTVDLFATRHYKQLPVFSFRKPDPGSSAVIDSLSLYWSNLHLCMFSHFLACGG